MARTLVVGDIHGALKALQQLISKVELLEDDRLIFLGDYVDGWSESAAVIDLLIELDKKYNCVFIKGNHDVWAEQWLKAAPPDSTWLFNGGLQTIKSYDNYTTARCLQHLEFYNRMKNYFVDEKKRLFIHAGFSSMHGPDKEHHESNYFWDRTLWEMARTMDKHIAKNSLLYPKRLLHFREIYIGHTPTTEYEVYEPMQACNVWNIDTGVAFNGKLSAMDIDTRELWQSDVVQQLYPNEKGRNK